MVKWITSLVLILAVTAVAFGGFCGCLEGHSDTHSCCKPDKSGKSSFSAKGCCSADCETASSNNTPGKKNADIPFSKSLVKNKSLQSPLVFWPTQALVPLRAKAGPGIFGHRLTAARAPCPLYLRHSSFLI